MSLEQTCQEIMKQAIQGKYDPHSFYKEYKTTSLFEVYRRGFLLRVIFNHTFAKAFWGEKVNDDSPFVTPLWQRRLEALATLETDEQKICFMGNYMRGDVETP